ncbi:MAG TPA: DUF6169 family protein [Chitinophagaceae bacterium]|nr:DUF6169 family protein [Chitinophagaceae bacterium]
MLSPYPLQVNDEYSFEFITETGIRYKIYFLDYSYLFNDYTHITCPVYSFNIDAIEGNPDLSPGDDRVGATVSVVMNLFFSQVDNVGVYVCDTLDDRQQARKRKFDSWFYAFNDGSLIKEDGLAIVEGTEIYNALLLHKNNSQLTEIILAYKELNERAGDKDIS